LIQSWALQHDHRRRDDQRDHDRTALSTHVLATLGIRNAFEIARPDLGMAAVMSALPLMIPLVIVLMRKLRTTEVQL
jgi:ABC-type sugar transport system permease subunit